LRGRRGLRLWDWVGDVGADAAGCVALALEALDQVHLVVDERACPSAESGAM